MSASSSRAFKNSSSTLTMDQYDLFKRIVRKNMQCEGVARGVLIRIARMRKPFLRTEEDKMHLAFAREAEGTSRTVRAINHLAEMEGFSGRLVDNVREMKEDYVDKRSSSEFLKDMSALSAKTAKLN